MRGRGLIAAVEIGNKETGESFPAAAAGYLQKACQDNGLIGRAVAGNSIAFCPPLIISKAQVDELIEKLGKSLDETLKHCKAEDFLE